MHIKTRLRKIHKYVGFLFSIIFIHLLITGLMLLYADQLNLQNVYVSSKFILNTYDLATQDDVYTVKINRDNEIVLIGNNVYYNEIPVHIESKNSLVLSDAKVGTSVSGEEVYLRLEDLTYMIDIDEGLKSVNIKNKNLPWKKFTKVTRDKAVLYLNFHPGPGVSLLKIITELHNGKFIGSLLIYAISISSVGLLYLIISGFIFGLKFKKINKKK